MDEKVLELMKICQDKSALVVRDNRGKLILMPYDKDFEEKGYTKIWVGSPRSYFEDENGPKKYEGLPADMLYEQLVDRIMWKEKMYIGAQIALSEIRDAFLGLPSPRVINNTQHTIKEVKAHLARLNEKDREKYYKDLKDLLALEKEEQ